LEVPFRALFHSVSCIGESYVAVLFADSAQMFGLLKTLASDGIERRDCRIASYHFGAFSQRFEPPSFATRAGGCLAQRFSITDRVPW
jgi:hypothetical protein